MLFEAVLGLLMTPEPEHPLNTVLAEDFLFSRERYNDKARQHTLLHATAKSLEELQVQFEGTGSLPAERPPQDLICPLTCKLFIDPVVTDKGIVYEREHIEAHLTTMGPYDPQLERLSADALGSFDDISLRVDQLRLDNGTLRRCDEWRKAHEQGVGWWDEPPPVAKSRGIAVGLSSSKETSPEPDDDDSWGFVMRCLVYDAKGQPVTCRDSGVALAPGNWWHEKECSNKDPLLQNICNDEYDCLPSKHQQKFCAIQDADDLPMELQGSYIIRPDFPSGDAAFMLRVTCEEEEWTRIVEAESAWSVAKLKCCLRDDHDLTVKKGYFALMEGKIIHKERALEDGANLAEATGVSHGSGNPYFPILQVVSRK